MITWHPVTGGYSATVMAEGVVLARLHARNDAWQIEHLGGVKAGKVSGVAYAKRAAIEALAAVLAKATHEVQVASKST